MKRLLLLMLLTFPALADDTRDRGTNPASVIEDSMCIPGITGQGCLHVDEDVANLVINVIAPDGTNIAVYDAGTEIEDISVIGTYAAPSANNVRVSPQANSGSDYTQMMFADSVFNGQEYVIISVSDGESTIMDFERKVVLSDSFWDIQCEDQGGGVTCREAMSILLAEAAGTAVYTSGTRTWVVKDPSGTETRLTLVYGAELDGDRSTSTLAPITP